MLRLPERVIVPLAGRSVGCLAEKRRADDMASFSKRRSSWLIARGAIHGGCPGDSSRAAEPPCRHERKLHDDDPASVVVPERGAGTQWIRHVYARRVTTQHWREDRAQDGELL